MLPMNTQLFSEYLLAGMVYVRAISIGTLCMVTIIGSVENDNRERSCLLVYKSKKAMDKGGRFIVSRYAYTMLKLIS